MNGLLPPIPCPSQVGACDKAPCAPQRSQALGRGRRFVVETRPHPRGGPALRHPHPQQPSRPLSLASPLSHACALAHTPAQQAALLGSHARPPASPPAPPLNTFPQWRRRRREGDPRILFPCGRGAGPKDPSPSKEEARPEWGAGRRERGAQRQREAEGPGGRRGGGEDGRGRTLGEEG